MLKIILGLIIVMLFSPRLGFAAPAVLIEDGKPFSDALNSLESGGWRNKEKPVSEGKSVLQHYNEQIFQTAYDLRTKRRVGVGGSVAGASGLFGALIELNFSPEDSAVVQFGGGPQYNTFTAQWKHILGDTSADKIIHPYFGLAYSRWYSVSGNSASINKTTPSFLATRYLTDAEKKSGRFEKNLVVPSLGLEYFQLDGPYKGAGVFVEVDILLETSDLSPVPTGSVGSVFYF